jgi:hypothetical protein
MDPEKMHTAIPVRSKSYITVTFDATSNYLLTNIATGKEAIWLYIKQRLCVIFRCCFSP